MVEKQIVVQPLQGKRVLVTRTRDQASVFCEQLRELGAIPVEFPTIRIVPPQDWTQLDAALGRLYATDGTTYDWLVFTSANGVNICLDRSRSLGYNPQAMTGVRVAAIGPATAAALMHYGITADLMPDEYIAEGVADALIKDVEQRGMPMAGQRILLARAAEARKVLVTELQRAGARVDEVAGYYTVPATSEDEQGREILRLLQNHQLDILTFTSSSTVRNFVTWLKSCEQGEMGSLMDLVTQQTRLASIGPITSKTARELGLNVDIEAKTFTINGLVTAIIQYEETSWQNRP
ncbi:MAG TPA: uroporphyrinogen-III synthase [Ktedonobacteraceae bacterium]|nr:uroporphyrinogen-III synthase [Ktedonobacteraceae bacterium]